MGHPRSTAPQYYCAVSVTQVTRLHTPPLMTASPSPMARLHHAHANGNEARDTNEVAADGPNHSTAQLWVGGRILRNCMACRLPGEGSVTALFVHCTYLRGLPLVRPSPAAQAALAVGRGSGLRLLCCLLCSACFAVCCYCACFVALALLTAFIV